MYTDNYDDHCYFDNAIRLQQNNLGSKLKI